MTQAPTALIEALRSSRFRYTSEYELQLGISNVMDGIGVSYEREFCLDANSRLDFFVDGGIGVEVKIDGSPMELGTQIIRYLRDKRLNGMLVVTTRSSHRDIPRELEGKPVWVVYLFSSAF